MGNPEDGVALQLAGDDWPELHRRGGVDDEHHVFAQALRLGDHALLRLRQRQVVGRAVGIGVEFDVRALLAAPGDEHQGGAIGSGGGLLIAGRIELGDGEIAPQRALAALGGAGALRLREDDGLAHLGHAVDDLGIQPQAAVVEGVVGADRLVRPLGGAGGRALAVDGAAEGVAQGHHLRVGGQRQNAVVLQQDAALGVDALRHRIARVPGGLGGLILLLIVPPVQVPGLDDGPGPGPEELVEGGFHHDGSGVQHNADHQDDRHQRDHPAVSFLLVRLICHPGTRLSSEKAGLEPVSPIPARPGSEIISLQSGCRTRCWCGREPQRCRTRCRWCPRCRSGCRPDGAARR